MKLIGVVGKTGVGKTTFTNYLSAKPRVGVIHVDEIIDEAKNKYFGFILNKRSKKSKERFKEESYNKSSSRRVQNGKIEDLNKDTLNYSSNDKDSLNEVIINSKDRPVIKQNIKELFYGNKFLFKIWMKIRKGIINRGVKKRLHEFKLDGKKLVIIDDWALNADSKIYDKLDEVFVVHRKYLKRREGIRIRDHIDTPELKIEDSPYALGYISLPTKKDSSKVTVIKNDAELKDLYKQADRIYLRLVEPSFDEKYKVDLSKGRGKSFKVKASIKSKGNKRVVEEDKSLDK